MFTYNAAAPPVNSAASLLNFLATGHHGVCVQSAWAMTVLTRLLGIPARLAGGFTEGTRRARETPTRSRPTTRTCGPRCTSRATAGSSSRPPRGRRRRQRTAQQLPERDGDGRSHVPPPSPGRPDRPPGRPRPADGRGRGQQVPPGTAADRERRVGQVRRNAAGRRSLLAILAAIALACGVIAIVAPPAHRALSAHAPTGPGGGPVSLTSVALVVAAAAIVALALYRLLAHTSGLNLRAAGRRSASPSARPACSCSWRRA